MQILEPYYETNDSEFVGYRRDFKTILQNEDELTEIVQLVGKVSELAFWRSDRIRTLWLNQIRSHSRLQRSSKTTSCNKMVSHPTIDFALSLRHLG
jgi:vacuolar-type H+-ATPase catalytic subunit A/Vma1